MLLDQSLRDGETEPGALVLLHQGALALHERLEQAREQRFVHAGSFVAHPESDRALRIFGADVEHGALGAELERIREQVEEHLAQLPAIGEDVGGRGELGPDLDRSLQRLRADQRDRIGDRVARSDRFQLQFHPPGFDLGQIEDVVDQGQEVPAACQHVCDELEVLG